MRIPATRIEKRLSKLLRAFKSTKKKHKDVMFLYDTITKEYIGKLYNIENQEEIAKAFQTAYNNLLTKKEG